MKRALVVLALLIVGVLPTPVLAIHGGPHPSLEELAQNMGACSPLTGTSPSIGGESLQLHFEFSPWDRAEFAVSDLRAREATLWRTDVPTTGPMPLRDHAFYQHSLHPAGIMVRYIPHADVARDEAEALREGFEYGILVGCFLTGTGH